MVEHAMIEGRTKGTDDAELLQVCMFLEVKASGENGFRTSE